MEAKLKFCKSLYFKAVLSTYHQAEWWTDLGQPLKNLRNKKSYGVKNKIKKNVGRKSSLSVDSPGVINLKYCRFYPFYIILLSILYISQSVFHCQCYQTKNVRLQSCGMEANFISVNLCHRCDISR